VSAEKNPDLVAVHKQLIALVDQLSQQQESATTAAAVKAITLEIVEVTHRVTMVGQLLFKERTDKLSAAVEAVKDGQDAVDAAIEKIEKLNGFVKAITQFLMLVDRVVDTAKLIA